MNKPATKFVMYSGLNTIGGVNASVTYGKDRVVFEFGSAYDPSTAVFDGKVEPRRSNWVRDKLRVGLLPRIDGIYRREDLGDYPLVSAEESDVNTAVFITHLHLDHMAFVGTIAPEIPVYMHRNAVLIERALEATGEGVETLEREYRDVVPFEPVRVGEIEVLPILCRDTSYYDFAFLITTPDGTIHWTGDLCLHGTQAERTFAQMELLKAKGVDVMLCDCTSFMDGVMKLMYDTLDPKAIKPSPRVPAGMLAEKEYYEGLYGHIRDCRGLLVFNYYQREMDDAAQFIEWARMSGRRCAFEPDAAYIVHKFFGIKPDVYMPDSPRYAPENREDWLRELLGSCTLVTNEEIAQKPSGFLLQNSYRHIMELFSLPAGDALYLHADGIPIGEFDPSYRNMRKIVEKAGFDYVTFFCDNYFGHGYPCQVKYFVDEVDPKVLIPCHSHNPERLLPNHGVQLLPRMYKTYVLENHALREGAPEDEDE